MTFILIELSRIIEIRFRRRVFYCLLCETIQLKEFSMKWQIEANFSIVRIVFKNLNDINNKKRERFLCYFVEKIRF